MFLEKTLKSTSILRARQQSMRNLPIEIDAAEKYPHDKNRETREKVS